MRLSAYAHDKKRNPYLAGYKCHRLIYNYKTIIYRWIYTQLFHMNYDTWKKKIFFSRVKRISNPGPFANRMKGHDPDQYVRVR